MFAIVVKACGYHLKLFAVIECSVVVKSQGSQSLSMIKSQ